MTHLAEKEQQRAMQSFCPILLGMTGFFVEQKHQIFSRIKAQPNQFVDKRLYMARHDEALRTANINPNPHRWLDEVRAI
ncbi:hypothetical protein D3C78_1548260 [compost metagenome]